MYPVEPKIEQLAQTVLTGMRVRMSVSTNKTQQLWQQFMPRNREIEGRASPNRFAVQVYDQGLNFSRFTPATEFDMWAAVDVMSDAPLPDGMEQLVIPAGQYAVFIHKGLPDTFATTTSRYIFTEWLPASTYELDDRPHFQLMPPAYRPDDPEAEEEVWVPIRTRNGKTE